MVMVVAVVVVFALSQCLEPTNDKVAESRSSVAVPHDMSRL